MATMTSYTHGQFCWIDLMAHDMSTAKQFYGGLFGWQAEDQDTQGGPPYAIYTADGQGLCGMGQMSDEMKASGMPPVWNSYVNVDDVDAAISKAEGLGATITMPPMQVGEAGKMAIIQDPAGAFVSFWEKINNFGAQQVNAPNTWGWNELLCNDPDIAIKFYSELFGWTFDKEPNSPNDYWIFKNGDRMAGGLMRRADASCPARRGRRRRASTTRRRVGSASAASVPSMDLTRSLRAAPCPGAPRRARGCGSSSGCPRSRRRGRCGRRRTGPRARP